MFRRLAVLALVTGCTAKEQDVAPPQYTFYYPAGLAVSPSEKSLFVLSANSDLRYSTGTIARVNLDELESLTQASLARETPTDRGCARVADRPQVLACRTDQDNGDPRPVMVTDATVQVGNFGVAMGIQELDSGLLRVFATVRGDPSITFVDYEEDPATVDCGPDVSYPRCSPEHRLTRLRSAIDELAIPPEPFYIAVDGANETVMAAHLTSGAVTLIDAPRDGSMPLIHDINQNFWALVGASGLIGAVGVAPRTPGIPGTLYYVTSRFEARVVGLTVGVEPPPPPPAPPQRPSKVLVRSMSFFLNGITGGGFENDARGIVFSRDGNRAYIVGRSPPSLQIFDTSAGPTGAPVNRFLGVVEACEEAASLALADFGEGPRIIMPCFTLGQMWVINPQTFSVDTTEDVGRGPASVAVSESRKRIYLANYAEDTVSVLDATPNATTQNRMVLRLGTLRPTEQ